VVGFQGVDQGSETGPVVSGIDDDRGIVPDRLDPDRPLESADRVTGRFRRNGHLTLLCLLGEVDCGSRQCGVGGLVSTSQRHGNLWPGPAGGRHPGDVFRRVVFELDLPSELPDVGTDPGRDVFDGCHRLGLLDTADQRHTRLDDPCFFAGNLVEFATQQPGVVSADAGNDRGDWLAEVGGIEASAEPDFEHGPADTAVAEVLPGQRGGQLEVGR